MADTRSATLYRMLLPDHTCPGVRAPVDACSVDGQLAVPEPGGFYGGWVTSDLAAPFKVCPEARSGSQARPMTATSGSLARPWASTSTITSPKPARCR